MLYTYSTNVSVAAGANIPFNTNGILTNTSVSHTAGDTNIYIKKPGFYKITHICSGANSTATAGNIIPTLTINGVSSTYAFAIAQSTGTTNITNLAFETIIQVVPSTPNNYVTLTIKNAGVATLFNNVILSIERIA